MESQVQKSNKRVLLVVIAVILLLLIGVISYFNSSDDSTQDVATEETSNIPDTSDQSSEDTDSSSAGSEITTESGETEIAEEVDEDVVEESVKLEIDVVRVEPTGEVVVAGRYAPDSIVSIGVEGKVHGETKANDLGEWVIVFEENLVPGSYLFQVVTQTDENSEEVIHDTEITIFIPENPQDGEVLVAVNTGDGATEILQLPEKSEAESSETEEEPKPEDPKPEDPQVQVVELEPEIEPETEVEANEEVESVTKTEPETAKVQVEVQVESTPEIVVDPKYLTIRAVETEDGKLFVAGEGNQGAEISVFVNDELVGHTSPNHQNRWLLQAEKSLEPGIHDIEARVIDNSTHTVIASVSVKFEKEPDSEILIPVVSVGQSSAAGAAGATSDVRLNRPPNVIIRKGDNLWRISRRLYGRGIRYTTIYEANKDQIDDPDLIFPGQIFLTPERDLNWSQ